MFLYISLVSECAADSASSCGSSSDTQDKTYYFYKVSIGSEYDFFSCSFSTNISKLLRYQLGVMKRVVEGNAYKKFEIRGREVRVMWCELLKARPTN